MNIVVGIFSDALIFSNDLIIDLYMIYLSKQWHNLQFNELTIALPCNLEDDRTSLKERNKINPITSVGPSSGSLGSVSIESTGKIILVSL